MNKKDIQIIQTLIFEIESRMTQIKSLIGATVPAEDFNVWQMKVRDFFELYHVPFSTNRVLKWFDSEGINTVEEVMQLDSTYLSRCRNLGSVSIRYIERCLAQHGLHLKNVPMS